MTENRGKTIQSEIQERAYVNHDLLIGIYLFKQEEIWLIKME